MSVPEAEYALLVPEGRPELSANNVLNYLPRIINVTNRQVRKVLKALVERGCVASLWGFSGPSLPKLFSQINPVRVAEGVPEVVETNVVVNEDKTHSRAVRGVTGPKVWNTYGSLDNVAHPEV